MSQAGRGGAGSNKRKREEVLQPPEDPSVTLLRSILVLGDEYQVRRREGVRGSED